MLWVLCVSALLPGISPRLQNGITCCGQSWNMANKIFSCRYIYYGFSSLLSCESPEIPILEVKNGI